MIRICRIVAKTKIFDILSLPEVSKIEIKQGKQNFDNPAICKVQIYLLPDSNLFKACISLMQQIADKNNNNKIRTSANMALQNGFIKESTFDNCALKMPKYYKKICEKYSQDFFNVFNRS